MSYSISSLAIRGGKEASALASLGLEKTGETREVPESEWSSTQLGDWFLIWSNSFEPSRFRNAPSKLEREVIICHVEEHVMFASASAFSEGVQRWRIVHESEKARDHLVVEGKPPETFDSIRAQEFARVKDDPEVDFIFEIPIRMAQEIVGFRHDAQPTPEFNVLRDSSKKWWRF